MSFVHDSGWEVFATDDTFDLVVLCPIDDLIEHEIDNDCICGVEMEPIKRKDGSVAWLEHHHALDGRE